MATRPYPAATTIRIGEQDFISHLYSASQALDLLLSLGEALAAPLSALAGREVSSDLSDIANVLSDIDDIPTTGALLKVFSGLRKAGGSQLLVQILQTTWYQDKPINSLPAFDRTFSGPAGLLVAAQLTWRVLVFQLRPLWEGLQPLLSAEVVGKLKARVGQIQKD